jgi:hypothetical protein
MSLNSKNELLAFIKEDLKKNDENENRSIKSVISTINKKYFRMTLGMFLKKL